MSRRAILGACLTLTLVLAAILIGARSAKPQASTSISIQIDRKEDWEYTTLTLIITNRTSTPVVLESDVRLEYLDAGGAVVNRDAAISGNSTQLLPWKTECLLFDHRDTIQALRVRLRYSYNAGPLRKTAGRVIGALALSRPLYRWAWSRGLVDGKIHRDFEGDWQVPPDRVHPNPDTLVCTRTEDRAIK